MEVILFHRTHRKSWTGNGRQNTQVLVPKPEGGVSLEGESINLMLPQADMYSRLFSDFEYRLSQKGDTLSVVFSMKIDGKEPARGSFRVTLTPWSVLNFYYRPSSGLVSITDAGAVHPVLGDSENLAENYLGRVVITDIEALLYLRGRFGRVEGFRNVIFEDDETSGTAFVRHSPKVARLLVDLEERKVRLGRVDLYRQIACLEAQVDLLTELVLVQRGRAPDTTPGSTEAEILRRVLRDSLPDSISADDLKALLDYKRTLREIEPNNQKNLINRPGGR